MSEDKELYLRSATEETLDWVKNYDGYIRQGEPAQREKAGYWQAAIGLQTVDGLNTLTISLSIWSVSSATCFWVNSGIFAIAICILLQQECQGTGT